MDAELDDEETLWAAEEELRAAQLMIEQAQRNRAEAAAIMHGVDGSAGLPSWHATFARSQEEHAAALRREHQELQEELWRADLELREFAERRRAAAALAGERELELLAADHAATARAARGLRRWRRASQRAAGRQVERSAALWWRDGALGAALRYWARSCLRARGAARACVLLLVNRRWAWALRRWRRHARVDALRDRALGRRAVACWRRQEMAAAHAALCRWRDRRRLLLRGAAERFALPGVRVALGHLRRHAQRRHTARHALVLWLLRRVGNALRAWTTMVMRRIEATMRLRRALASWMLRAAAAALRSWYEEARLGRAMRAVALGLRHRGLRAAVNGWRGVTDTRRDTLSRLSRAGGALLQKELRAAYVCWAVAAARAASIAELLHFAVLRWLGRRVGAAWRRWAAAAAAGLAAEMSLRRVLGYWHFSKMATAWRTWRAAAATTAAALGVLERAAGRWVDGAVAYALSGGGGARRGGRRRRRRRRGGHSSGWWRHSAAGAATRATARR